MNTISRNFLAFSALAAIGLCNTAMAANLACKPDVKVINEKPASIKVLNFKYKVGGDDHTESLNNRKIGANGDNETWKSQKLGHAAKDNVITAIAIDFKNDNSGDGDGYGPSTPSAWFTQSGGCTDSRTYTITIK